jgi:hypothetical protein
MNKHLEALSLALEVQVEGADLSDVLVHHQAIDLCTVHL